MRHAVLLGALGLAACTAPPPSAPTDARVIATPVVRSNLGVSLPSVTALPDGRLRVVVNLENPAPNDFPLRVQTDWFDAAGRPISTVASRPQTRSAARSTVTTIDADAPSARARDFRMTLDLEGP